jgi:DNA processing protein
MVQPPLPTLALHRDDPRYPEALLDLNNPPPILWARGDLSVLQKPCVAIVGTRRATAYGARVTRELSGALARAGACVVSGLARGIDANAHLGALDANGATCAVLGTGLDVVYPKAHDTLQAEIGSRGLLLSELEPNDPSAKGSFPKRNRIIAALARLTIVVEAGIPSGARLTADAAERLNRMVAAVPGPIDVPQAAYSNLLLRDGAHPITCMQDAIALMGLTAPIRLATIPEGSNERRLWDALSLGSADLDTLCTRSGLPARDGVAAASALELLGLVECALTGEVRRATD